MGFHEFATPYDWSRLTPLRERANAVEGGAIDMSVGSPVDEVPQSVRQALAQAAGEPCAYGYPPTVGITRLREAITAWYERCREVSLHVVDADVLPTVGSKEAVALMASLLQLGEGDVVVQPTVSYPTYEIGTQLAGASVCKVDDVANVESWRDIEGVKAIWVNSPCNPTGQVLSVQDLRRIVSAARAIGATVLSDECYALLHWADGGRPAPCMLDVTVCEGSANGILALYSLSKQSNMAGYRAAWIAGDAAMVRRMAAYRKQIGQIIPGPVQASMAAALRDDVAVADQFACYRRRLDTLVEALGNYGYDAQMPQGGLYVWVKARSGDCWQDMSALAALGILPSPGEFYGAPGYLRFSATVSDEAIASAVRRLALARR